MSQKYETSFGFTEKEVFEALDDANMPNEKIEVKLDELSSKIGEILELIQQNMFDTCKKRMEAKTTIAHNLEEFQANMNKEQGFIKAMWCGNEECEAKIKELTLDYDNELNLISYGY